MRILENDTIKFYSSRIKTGLLGTILLAIVYMIYIKVLADPYGITEVARVVVWFSTVFAFVMGIICFVMAFDPRPVVEIMPEGIIIRSLIFFEDLVLWDEIAGVEQEQHTSSAVNMAGYIRVTTHVLRIYRPMGRTLTINLSLLNKRGNTFINTFNHYANPVNDHIATEEGSMNDERLLIKYHQAIIKNQKLNKKGFTLLGKIISLFLSVLILLWILNYFRTIDFNPISIIGFIVVFFIIWIIMLLISEFLIILITNPNVAKEKAEHQIENFKKIIRARIKPENMYTEFVVSFPLSKIDGSFFHEENGSIHFYPRTDEGQTEQVTLLKEHINISREKEDDDGEAAYKLYAQKVLSGTFKNELIGDVRELYIPY